MKRKDMIDKIFQPFKENFKDNIPVVITPFLIDSLLNELEELGMLPPVVDVYDYELHPVITCYWEDESPTMSERK